MLIHGEDDTVVPFSHSDKMADALKDAGKSYELSAWKAKITGCPSSTRPDAGAVASSNSQPADDGSSAAAAICVGRRAISLCRRIAHRLGTFRRDFAPAVPNRRTEFSYLRRFCMAGGGEQRKSGETFTFDQTIMPGTWRGRSVSQQVTGLDAALALRVMHGSRPGYVFVAGGDGDEIVGTAIIQRLLARLAPGMLAGTIIFALRSYLRLRRAQPVPSRSPRSQPQLPGAERGSLASRLAHSCHPCDRPLRADDIHSAASWYSLPQIRIASGSPYLSELAMAFGAPIIIENPLARFDARSLEPQCDAAARSGRGAALRPPRSRPASRACSAYWHVSG